MESCSGTVFIVDDDEAIRDALRLLFESRGKCVRLFASAGEFLASDRGGCVGCLVLDVRMPGMSGLELHERLQREGCRVPVVFLTGHGDVSTAVRALKGGAVDFVEKPFSDNDLVDRVEAALRLAVERRRAMDQQAALQGRIDTLTPRERQVMELMLAGRLNKQIADDLAISMRTVEVHRARVLEKMGARSVLELAQRLGRAAPAVAD
jgi:two-component system response regulator DctR